VLAVVAWATAACDVQRSSPTSPSPPSSLGATVEARVTDPAGDAVVDMRVIPVTPDLVEATVVVDAGLATVTVLFAPGRFGATSSTAQMGLDMDGNAASGDALADLGLGVEVVINLGMNTDGTAQIRRFNSTTRTYSAAGSVAQTVLGNGWRIAVPVATLGGDVTRARLRVVCAANVGGGVTTGILDYMPNQGSPAGTFAAR
jgi:hypothetical protein